MCVCLCVCACVCVCVRMRDEKEMGMGSETKEETEKKEIEKVAERGREVYVESETTRRRGMCGKKGGRYHV